MYSNHFILKWLAIGSSAGLRFGDHDQESVHTSVDWSCVLAHRSVTFFNVRSDKTTTEILRGLSSGQRWRT